jgi:hypothetical protein
MQNVESISTMTLKISFVTILNWKFYIWLFFYVRKDIIKYDITKDTRDFVILHEIHVYLNQICILNLNAKTMNQSSNIFHIRSKRTLKKRIILNLIHQLIIDFNRSELHQYDFNQNLIKFYSILQHAYFFFQISNTSFIRLLLNTNQLIFNTLKQFEAKMKINVLDYEDFYFKHSSQHFIQFDDYSSSKKRSFVKILASSILNIWSKYTIVYEFDFIMKHEVVIIMNKNVRKSIFKLRLMNVLDFQDKYYIEFLKKSNKLNYRFNIDDRLNINFTFLMRSKKTNWQALIIDAFSCTSLKNVCVSMYRFKNFEIEAYSTQTINALSCDIVDMNTTFRRI